MFFFLEGNLVEMNGVMSDKCMEAFEKEMRGMRMDKSLKMNIEAAVKNDCKFSAFTSYHLVHQDDAEVYHRVFWPVCFFSCD